MNILTVLETRGILQEFEAICKKRGVIPEELFGSARGPHISFARRQIVYWMHDELGWSFNSIARLLGKTRDTISDDYKTKVSA